MRDLKFIIGLLLVCFAILIAVGLIIGHADAIDTNTEPTLAPIFIQQTPTNISELNNHTYTIHRIQQGDKVYLGDHIDISGVVAGNRALVWFRGGEPDPAEQPYVIPLPNTKAGYFDWFVDPATFSQMTGDIFKWNGYFEPSGNTHAFTIIANYRNDTRTYPNGTVINETSILSGQYPIIEKPVVPVLPAKHVADYLAVHNQPFNITTAGKSKLWLFGRVDGIYDRLFPTSEAIIDVHDMQSLEAGNYQMLIQYPGENGVFESYYDPSTYSLRSARVNKTTYILEPLPAISLYGVTPQIAIEQVKTMLGESDDRYSVQSVSIEEPSIQLVSMEEVSTSLARTYYNNSNLRGDVTVFDIKGYINVLPGTNLYFALDEKNQVEKVHWFNATAQGQYLGDERIFEAFVPVYWDEMSLGMHTISGYTDVGGSIFRDFPVRDSPDHSFIPNQSVKWIDNQSPWVPTPTPEIIRESYAVPGPERTIIVTQTPSPEEIHTEAQKITDEQNRQNNEKVMLVGIALVALVFLGWGVWSIIRARKGEKK